MAKVKITVVKRCNYNALFPENPPVGYVDTMSPQCPVFKEGQEFIIDDVGVVPKDFCAWAYTDIHTQIIHLLLGGYFDWVIPRTSALACCTDGSRPVIFKLERIED